MSTQQLLVLVALCHTQGRKLHLVRIGGHDAHIGTGPARAYNPQPSGTLVARAPHERMPAPIWDLRPRPAAARGDKAAHGTDRYAGKAARPLLDPA